MVFIDFCLNSAFPNAPLSFQLHSRLSYYLLTPVLLHHDFQLHSLLFRASLKLYPEITCHTPDLLFRMLMHVIYLAYSLKKISWRFIPLRKFTSPILVTRTSGWLVVLWAREKQFSGCTDCLRLLKRGAFKRSWKDVPGGAVVKTSHFYGRGHRKLRSHMPHHVAKKKNKTKQ